MSKKYSVLCSIIGKSTSGKILEIPLQLSQELLESTLGRWTPDEKVDVFCILEYTLFHRTVENLLFDDHESMVSIYNSLVKQACLQEMSSIIESRGLRTSVDRLRMGISLSI